MKKIIFIQIIPFICLSCSADNTPVESKADFEFFTFSGAIENSVSIDPAGGMITAKAVLETDMETIVPEFVLSQGAKALVDGKPQASGETQHDFTSSVEYTLISGDGKTIKTWMVSITNDYPFASVWKVKACRRYYPENYPNHIDNVLPEEPVELVPPADVVYPYYKIEIPDFTEGFKGIAYGNSFLDLQWFEYEIKGRQQINISCVEYCANQFSVTFKDEVDFAYATEFAANSNHEIFPQKYSGTINRISRSWRFYTDGTEDVLKIIDDLNQQQHPNVENVKILGAPLVYFTGCYQQNYWRCIYMTEKFKFSGNELIFMDAEDKATIVFERIEKE